MSAFLGVDGGGSKTRFLLIDEAGRMLAGHAEGSAYHVETGIPALRAMLAHGIGSVLKRAALGAGDVAFAFFGIPGHGEDRALEPELDALPSVALPAGRYRCGNDMICGWAGALAARDGINVVAGTGSIAYGEYAGRGARAGGWSEVFGDEGSAYWVAREGLELFSRMSDGRTVRGPLYEVMRRHLNLQHDLDLCALVYRQPLTQRSRFAQLSKVVAQAAQAGDADAQALFARAAAELALLADAVRSNLQVPADIQLPVSCSGGMFGLRELIHGPFEAALARRPGTYRLVPARLAPEAGAALYAAKLAGSPLSDAAIAALEAGAAA